jgi:hypothetical protein
MKLHMNNMREDFYESCFIAKFVGWEIDVEYAT